MAFPTLATVNATNDVSELFIYVNTLTNGKAVPSVLFAFFMITFLATIFLQIRFNKTANIKGSFAGASFSTFGFAVILSLKSGLLNPIFLFMSLALLILSALWLILSSDD